MKRSALSPMSAKRRAALAAAGNARPFSTLVNRSTLARPARSDGKPALRAQRPAGTGPDAATVQVVVGRDQGCCVRCGRSVLGGERGRDWSVQHRRARGAGGSRLPFINQAHNLILLCGSGTTLCHGWVEHYPTAAGEHGWAISRYDDPAARFVDHYLHGRVWLTADGHWTEQAPAVAS